MTVSVVKWSELLFPLWVQGTQESFGPGFKWVGLNGQDGRFAILSYAVQTKGHPEAFWGLAETSYLHPCLLSCPLQVHSLFGRERVPLTLAVHFDLAGT